MKKKKLRIETIEEIQKLKQRLDILLMGSSDIDVIWELERFHQTEMFLKSANSIRKSITDEKNNSIC